MFYEQVIISRMNTLRILIGHFDATACKRHLSDEEYNERRDYEEERERMVRLLRVVHNITR